MGGWASSCLQEAFWELGNATVWRSQWQWFDQYSTDIISEWSHTGVG